MEVKNILILIGSIVIVSVLSVVKYIYPLKFNSYIFSSLVTITVLSTGLLYYLLNRDSNTCSSNDPGTCKTNKDCNNNGVCTKDNGVCGCICHAGFSGVHCGESPGIPWNSPHCMGPNTQYPARKDKNGMCVCPPGEWASGISGSYGYVQCLKCASPYGPLSGSAPCTYKWGVEEYLSNTCYDQNTDEVCSEFDYVFQEVGPNDEKGYTTPVKLCSSANSCRCSKGDAKSNRSVCQVTGYLDPNRKSEGCNDSSRACSSYNCK